MRFKMSGCGQREEHSQRYDQHSHQKSNVAHRLPKGQQGAGGWLEAMARQRLGGGGGEVDDSGQASASALQGLVFGNRKAAEKVGLKKNENEILELLKVAFFYWRIPLEKCHLKTSSDDKSAGARNLDSIPPGVGFGSWRLPIKQIFP